MMRSMRSAMALTVVPLLALPLTATGAEASTKWMYRSTTTSASADWVEWGTLPGVEGNAHVGFLEAYVSGSNIDVWGKVLDYQCDEGEVPGGGGGHGEDVFEGEPGEGECDFTGKRFISGGNVQLVIDKKLTGARLTGTLSVENHAGTANPPVDMTWTGQGGLSQSTYIEEYIQDGERYYAKYEDTRRQAAVTGYIGIMNFTDDADDESSASLAKTKVFERGMSR